MFYLNCSQNQKSEAKFDRLYKNLSVQQLIQYIAFLLMLLSCIKCFSGSSIEDMGNYKIIIILFVVFYFLMIIYSDVFYVNLTGKSESTDDIIKRRKLIISIVLTCVIVVVCVCMILPYYVLARIAYVTYICSKLLEIVVYIMNIVDMFENRNVN